MQPIFFSREMNFESYIKSSYDYFITKLNSVISTVMENVILILGKTLGREK